MSRWTDHERLAQLAGAMCGQTISPGEVEELDAILRADDAACEFYVDLLGLEAELPWTIGAMQDGRVLHARLPVAPPETNDSADSKSLPPRSGQEQPSKEKQSKEQSGEKQPREQAAPSNASLNDSGSWRLSAESLRSAKRSIFRHPQAAGVVAAAVLLIAVLGALAFTKLNPFRAGPRAAPPRRVAWISGAKGVQWLGDKPRRNEALSLGRRLKLKRGLVEITYQTGARVVLQGPAEYGVQGPSSGYLKLGKLVARVEGRRAKGFTIETPLADVVDLGTEFGIEVDGNGAAEVVVLTGEVDVVSNANADRPAKRVRLTANQVAFVEDDSGAITRREKIDSRVVASYRKRLDATSFDTVSAATVYNGGSGDLDQAGSWTLGLPSSSQDGLINSDGTLTAPFVTDFGGNTTIHHTAGDLDFGTNAFNMHGATNTYNMSGGSITAPTTFLFNQLTFNLGGGTITIGSATIANSSLLNVSGSAVIDLAGLGTSTGTIDFQGGWTGSFRIDTFSGTDWQDAFTTGLDDLDFTLDGRPVDAATFATRFSVSADGTTLRASQISSSPNATNGHRR